MGESAATAPDQLHAAAVELEASGMSRQEAEIEAVRRFGPVTPIVRATLRRSLAALVFETLRAALFLAGCGLVAVGISGLVALVMNLWFGRSFVGGVSLSPFQGAPVDETADDAVVLRVIAGLIGLLVLLGYLALRRHASSRPCCPPDWSTRLAQPPSPPAPPGSRSLPPTKPSRTAAAASASR